MPGTVLSVSCIIICNPNSAVRKVLLAKETGPNKILVLFWREEGHGRLIYFASRSLRRCNWVLNLCFTFSKPHYLPLLVIIWGA